MNKKDIIELLIKSFGLIPKDIKHYTTQGWDGQFEIGVGWKGEGVDKDNNTIISFVAPDGFNMAIYEILKQSKEEKLTIEYVDITK